MFKFCTGPASDERFHLRDLAEVEAETLSQDLVFLNTHRPWLGKFLIHNKEGIARTCDGFQAHLSSCASLKVLEVVDRLPEIIIPEKLPRLRIWSSQLMGGQVTEENNTICFFAKDVDRLEPDVVLLGCYQKKVQKVNNSAKTTISNSLKQGDGDTVKRGAIDVNAYPEDEDDDDAGVDEIRPSDAMPSLFGHCSSSLAPESVTVSEEAFQLKARPGFAVAGVNLAVQGRSTAPENDSVRNRIEHHVKELPTSSLSCAQPSTEKTYSLWFPFYVKELPTWQHHSLVVNISNIVLTTKYINKKTRGNG